MIFFLNEKLCKNKILILKFSENYPKPFKIKSFFIAETKMSLCVFFLRKEIFSLENLSKQKFPFVGYFYDCSKLLNFFVFYYILMKNIDFH